ncbi:hypothetical protein GCM10023078_33640 [Gibbsiella greigii]
MLFWPDNNAASGAGNHRFVAGLSKIMGAMGKFIRHRGALSGQSNYLYVEWYRLTK